LSRVAKASLYAARAINRAVDQVATAMRQASPGRPTTEIKPLVWDTVHPAAALQRASKAVAGGNLKVFAEIGRKFVRY
jgi:hypothetical protein